jgi:hypothetical protein
MQGFKYGEFHMEAWYTKEKGPMLIECNPRVGGGPIQVWAAAQHPQEKRYTTL